MAAVAAEVTTVMRMTPATAWHPIVMVLGFEKMNNQSENGKALMSRAGVSS